MAITELIVKLIGDVSGFQKTMNQVGREMKKTSKSIGDAGKTLTKLTAPIALMGAASVKVGSDFESAFAGIRKTVNASEAEFDSLRKNILQMAKEIPISAVELAKIGEAAGQLGVEKDAIGGFIRTMADLGVTTNLTSEQAAETMARFANITDMPQQKFSNLGSAVVALGNNFAGTEAEIMEMSLRLAGAGSTAGMTEGDILGMATALTSLGINAEAGGSAFSRVIKDIQVAVELGGEKLNDFALVSQMTTDDFARAFKEKPAEAVTSFIKGLSDIRDNGGSVIQTLEKLGFSEIRVSDALLRASGNSKLFTEAIDIGNKAFKDDVALKKEAEERYKTFESQVILLKNSIVDLGIEIFDVLRPILLDMVSGIKAAVEWFKGLDDSTKKTILVFAGIVTAAGPVLIIIGKIGVALGGFITMLGTAKTVAAVFASASGIGLILVAVAAATALFLKNDGMNAAIGGFNSIINSVTFQAFQEGLGMIISLTGTALTAVFNLGAAMGQAFNASEINAQNKLLEVQAKHTEQLGTSMTSLFKIIMNAKNEGQIRELAVHFGQFREAIEKSSLPMEEKTKQLKILNNAANLAQQRIDEFTGAVKKEEKAVETATDAVVDNTKGAKGNTAAVNINSDAKDDGTAASKKLTAEEKLLKKAQEESAKSADAHAQELDQLVTNSKKYEDVLQKVKDKSIPAEQSADELKRLYTDADKALRDYNLANENYQTLLSQYATSGNIPSEQLAEYIKKLDIAKGKLGEFTDEKGKGDKAKIDGLENFADEFENQMADALGNIMTTVLQGGSVRKDLADMGASMGSAFGAVAGSFAGPIGQAIGGAIGGAIGKDVGGGIGKIGKGTPETWEGILDITKYIPMIGQFTYAFDAAFSNAFGESEGTSTRKAIDKWFADQFDANKIYVVINNQLQRLKDFNFGGGMFGSLDSAAGQYFQTLDESSKAAFSGVATGMASMLGFGSEVAHGLAMVLAEQLGGSLNNLQVMVSGLGLSMEDLEKIVLESMLNSEMSFMDAQTALNGLKQIAQKGIPDAVGATVKAFENLKDAGIRGGRFSTDALRDIAYEAKELGITTIPALMQNLLASGKLTQREIDLVFQALRDHGIESIDALTDATDQQLLGVLSQLQQQEFPFADAVEDAKDLTKAINEMPKSKDITFNLKTNLDKNTEEAMRAGFTPNAQNTVSNPKPSAKGNIFSAGGIMPFAKGGIVSDFTLFDIGSMAERGPEAIMPLERLPDGDLGVRSASSGGGGGGKQQVNITINAPYAQPGAAEAIRREIDKYFDRKNRLPGVRR